MSNCDLSQADRLLGQLPEVAIMRKIITTLNAMVRDDVVWADHLHGRHIAPTAWYPLGCTAAALPGTQLSIRL